MGKNIALSGQIDPEHRARKHLGNSAFGNDLFFFRHGSIIAYPVDFLNLLEGLSAPR